MIYDCCACRADPTCAILAQGTPEARPCGGGQPEIAGCGEMTRYAAKASVRCGPAQGSPVVVIFAGVSEGVSVRVRSR